MNVHQSLRCYESRRLAAPAHQAHGQRWGLVSAGLGFCHLQTIPMHVPLPGQSLARSGRHGGSCGCPRTEAQLPRRALGYGPGHELCGPAAPPCSCVSGGRADAPAGVGALPNGAGPRPTAVPFRRKSDCISPLDDLAFDMYQDPEVARIIRALDERKREAARQERYDDAKKLRQALADLQKVRFRRGGSPPRPATLGFALDADARPVSGSLGLEEGCGVSDPGRVIMAQ